MREGPGSTSRSLNKNSALLLLPASGLLLTVLPAAVLLQLPFLVLLSQYCEFPSWVLNAGSILLRPRVLSPPGSFRGLSRYLYKARGAETMENIFEMSFRRGTLEQRDLRHISGARGHRNDGNKCSARIARN